MADRAMKCQCTWYGTILHCLFSLINALLANLADSILVQIKPRSPDDIVIKASLGNARIIPQDGLFATLEQDGHKYVNLACCQGASENGSTSHTPYHVMAPCPTVLAFF